MADYRQTPEPPKQHRGANQPIGYRDFWKSREESQSCIQLVQANCRHNQLGGDRDNRSKKRFRSEAYEVVIYCIGFLRHRPFPNRDVARLKPRRILADDPMSDSYVLLTDLLNAMTNFSLCYPILKSLAESILKRNPHDSRFGQEVVPEEP